MAETKGSNRLVTVVIGLWVVVCLGAAAIAGLLLYGPSRSVAGLKAGDPAPDFELLDTSGEVVRLSALRGQPVVVEVQFLQIGQFSKFDQVSYLV